MFEKGITPSEVARSLEVHRQSAGRWRKQWEQGGNKALVSKGRIGRKRALSEQQKQELAGILKAGAVAAGMPTEVWTLPRVTKVIRDEFGNGYHPAHVSKVLAPSMGFSCQRPTCRAIERDEEKIRHWQRHKWPAIKKACREGRLIDFIDETGVSTKPHRVRTWAPRGQTPVLHETFGWQSLSIIGAIRLWRILFRIHAGAINGDQVVHFRGFLGRHTRQSMLIV